MTDRHVRDSFFVVGEGVWSGAGHGPRPASPTEQERRFRFSRIGPKGRPLDRDLLAALATAMTVQDPPEADAEGVPAGYTYLGQFLDHDLTKDVTPVDLGDTVTVAELQQGRSPALDLDSVYGRGPTDLQDRRFYADDARLRLGVTVGTGPATDPVVAADLPGFDLPRVGVDPTRPQTRADQRAPLIADPRNDENLAVAQTHLAFLRFHNAVVDALAAAGTPPAALFETARESVVKHYQWMVRTDFLPRVVDPAVVDDVFAHGRRVFEVDATDEHPTVPVEFSVAAYRLGHSMVRDAYEWNRVFSTGGAIGPASLLLLFAFTGLNGMFAPAGPATAAALDDPDSPGALRLPSNWAVDLRRLYDFPAAGHEELRAPGGAPNAAKRLDTRLVDPLARLPLGSFGGRGTTPPAIERNLAFRNLVRGAMLELASGQQMAALLEVEPLTAEQLLTGDGGADLSGLTAAQQAELVARTPLWFYVLREAELAGGRMTGVGGRLVAEVFHRAMEGSRHSVVRDATWRPSLGPDAATFRMPDLLLVAAHGRVEELAPLGDAPLAPVPAQAAPAVISLPGTPAPVA